jgi:hypothetical protein
MFEGFMTGAFRFLLEVAHPDREIRALACTETQCAGDTTHEHCRFAFSNL